MYSLLTWTNSTASMLTVIKEMEHKNLPNHHVNQEATWTVHHAHSRTYVVTQLCYRYGPHINKSTVTYNVNIRRA